MRNVIAVGPADEREEGDGIAVDCDHYVKRKGKKWTIEDKPRRYLFVAENGAKEAQAVSERFRWIPPFRTACLPLSHSGNPEANDESYRGVNGGNAWASGWLRWRR